MVLSAVQVDMSFLMNMFDAIYDGVKIIDRHGRFLFINKSAERNMEIVRDEWIGRHAEELIPNSIILKALHTGTPQMHQHSVVLGKHFIVHASPLMYQGDVIGAVSTHKNEAELEQLKTSFHHAQLNKYVDFLENELHRAQELPAELKEFVISKGSPLMSQLARLRKLAPTDIPILIRGESGVGKEVIARGIHQLSNRMGKPYITINCAAIPEALLESELFGYEEGAFTGAKRSGSKGKFELANKGTIFLDEIGDMSYHLQAKLLRVLQQKELVRVGGSTVIPLDVRIIAATNCNLESMMQKQAFREDLYYRINGFTFTIPPLRERRMDTDMLIVHFLKELSYKYNKQIRISREAHEYLLQHPLPGNVRELKSVLEHGFVLAEADEIQITDLPHFLTGGQDPQPAPPQPGRQETSFDLTENVARLEVELIAKALQHTKHNRSQAIKLLGISRQSFYERLKRYETEIAARLQEQRA